MSKILFLASNPKPTSRLALDDEARLIEEKIRSANHRDALVFQTRWAVRFDDLLQALNQDRPVVVHFSGHGEQTQGIALHTDAGGLTTVATGTLQRLFAALKDEIRIVMLNACYSSEQARAIATVIDCVIGMNQPIRDGAAHTFAASFYRALGFGRSVRNAFDQGVLALEGHGLPEQAAPELFCRPGVDANDVFITPQPERSEQLIQPRGHELVILLFITGSSPPCRSTLVMVKELTAELPPRVQIKIVDIEGDEEAVSRYRIQHLPTALFMVNGVLKERQIGNLPRADWVRLIERYANEA